MADRYWVGGTAAWDGTAGTKWALTSGGAGGQAVPTSADDVFFSNLSTGTCTISTGNTGAKSINCTGFTGTIAGTAAITVSGSVTLVVGMGYTYTGALTINATSTITSAGKTFGDISVNTIGGTVTLADALTVSTINTTTLTAGTLALANFTLSTGIFSSSGSSTRAISFGSGNIALTITIPASTILAMPTATNFTWTGTGGFTRNMVATATVTFGTTGGTVSNAPNLTVNAGASTLTITGGSYFKNLIFTGSTCTAGGSVNMAGNLTLASGGAYTLFLATFLASSTITSNGRTISNATINIPGGTLTLADAMTTGSGSPNSTTLTAGTLNLAGFTLSTAVFLSNTSNTRAIAFGSGNIALTSTLPSTTILDMLTATNFTFTGTGEFTRSQGVAATVRFGNTGATTSNAPNLTVSSGASTLTVQGWFRNLIFTGSTCTVTGTLSVVGNLTLASGGTYTSLNPIFRASGTVTSTGKTIGNVAINAASSTVTLADAMTLDTTGTFTLSAGAINLANFNLSTGAFASNLTGSRSISFGSGNINLTSVTNGATVLSMATVTGFTVSGTGGFVRNQAATATVSFGSTTNSGISNVVNLTVNAGGSTLTILSGSYFKNVDFTGSTCTVAPLIGVVGLNMAGNLTLASGGTYTLVAPIFRASGTLTSNGQTLGNTIINGVGITVTLADAFVSNNALTLTEGTFSNPSNFNVTAFNFVSNSGSACSLSLGSSTWTITGGDAVASWVATNASLTFSAGTSTINLTYVGVKEFFAGNRTYYNVNVGGTGDFYIYGTNTFNNITNSVQPATVIFESGLTQTVSNFGLSGTAGNLVTISSEAAGFQFTLSKASGTVNAQYLSIQDSVATGGAVWNAFTSNGNVDAGNNTGWVFSAAGGNMFLMFS